MKNLLTFIFLLISSLSICQTISQKNSVLITSTSVSDNSITINWSPFSGSTNFIIYRKLKSETSWGTSIGSTTSNSFTDNTISPNNYYEYKIVRSSSQGTGYGYIASGKDISNIDYRGRIILLVDNTFTSSLSSHLSQLENDLILDGWMVSRLDLPRSTSISTIKSNIISIYNSDPTTKGVYIVGHLAVPYSGNLNPDGHGDHLGAWPCDGYYGELNGTWTDASNPPNNSQSSRNWNDANDGKFDQNSFPNSLELFVGRVDMFNMTQNGGAFGYYQGLSESQVLGNYLTRSHNFKIKQFTPQFRGAVFDNFYDVSNEPLSSSGYKSISSLVGSSNFTDLAPTGNAFSTYINNNSYLWTYACGGGTWVSASNVGNTDQYAGSGGQFSFGGIFNMTFGSYFGDWDITNGFLGAPLASGGLTNVWSGRPHWWFHHMGMGDPIGYSTIISINNNSTYDPVSSYSSSKIVMNLLGDPSLRQIMITPPSNLQFSNVGGMIGFSWTPSPDPVIGYNIYEITPSSIIRVNTNIVPSTNYTSTIPYSTGKTYMVRSVKLETTVTGTYYNMSLGTKSITTNIVPQIVKISPRVFLGGCYNSITGLMTDSLRPILPLSSPYQSMGYVHVANSRIETISPNVLLSTGSNAIVDWIIVELRSSNNTILSTRTGLLQRDGHIVDMDGVSPLEFDIPSGSYKVSVVHRNHLGVMTLSTQSLSNSPTNLDFRFIQLYGTNSMNSQNCLWPGDSNFDKQIKYTGSGNDRDGILIKVGSSTPNNISSGYHNEDINMDGLVKYTGSSNDRDIILITIGGSTPNNVRTQQIP